MQNPFKLKGKTKVQGHNLPKILHIHTHTNNKELEYISLQQLPGVQNMIWKKIRPKSGVRWGSYVGSPGKHNATEIWKCMVMLDT